MESATYRFFSQVVCIVYPSVISFSIELDCYDQINLVSNVYNAGLSAFWVNCHHGTVVEWFKYRQLIWPHTYIVECKQHG
jgi:hypothetical protein